MRLLFVGLDGFDYFLAQKWIEDGELPNLRQVVTVGDLYPLESLVPPLSPAVWTSILTGKNPGYHGVFDFTLFDRRKKSVELLEEFTRKVPNIFEILSLVGRGICAIGFPCTTPVEGYKIEGAVLSGWSNPFSVMGGRGNCTPGWVHDELVKVAGKGYLPFDVINQFAAHDERDAEWMVSKMEDSAIARTQIALFVANSMLSDSSEILAVYFPEGDAAGHHLWHLHDPNSPRRRGGKGKGGNTGGAPLLRVYRALDRAVGILIEGYKPDVAIIVSDHGMGGSGNMAFSLNRALSEVGMCKFKGKGWLKMFLPGLVEDFIFSAIGKIPPGLRQTLVKTKSHFRKLSTESLTLMRLGGIDFGGSIAFSEDAGLVPSLWINDDLLGLQNYSRGVEDGEDEIDEKEEEKIQIEREKIATRVIKELEEVSSFRKVVKSAWLKSTLYEGPYSKRIPDVIFELNLDEGYSYNMVPGLFREMKNTVEPLPAKYLSGVKGRTRHGSHRKTGVFILSKNSLLSGVNLGIYEIAPFILSLYGLERDRIESVADNCIKEQKYTIPQKAFHDSHSVDLWVLRERLEGLGYL